MASGTPELIQLVHAEIRAQGPISFAAFMERALYHPAHGYYSSGRCEIGRAGDYFTNVSVGPLFGRLMAAQFAEMWETLDRPQNFIIVEQGAHDGAFARDVLAAAQTHHSDFFAAVRYEIVEPFPILRARQMAALAEFAHKVQWRASLEDLPPFRGVHFSNELLDAMPVHLVRWTGTEWLERHVGERNGQLAFVDLPLSSRALADRLALIETPLPDGYETEVNLAAFEWMTALAPKLINGFVIAVDYGWPRAEFYAPHRTTGTLRCSAQHKVVASPLEQIGDADMTAHVEWTSIAKRAQQCGIEIAGFTDQHHFITGLLAGAAAAQFGETAAAKTTRQLQTLLHPQYLGMKFQYLVLVKGIAATAATLSGLRFAHDVRRSLSLSS